NGNKEKLFFSKRGNRKWTIKLSGNGYPFIYEFVKKNKFTIHSPIVSRRFLEENDLKFDESLNHNEDWDFWLKCLFKGANIHYLSNSAVYGLVRVHAQSASYRSINMALTAISIRKRIENHVRKSDLLTIN